MLGCLAAGIGACEELIVLTEAEIVRSLGGRQGMKGYNMRLG